MTYAEKYGLRPADRIIETIFATGISKHHVIYLGMDHQGIEWIAENYKFQGVRKIKAREYFKNKRYTIQRFNGNYQQRIEAVQRALSKMGEPYDLIDFNCEHYAEYVQNERSTSHQVELAGKILLVLFAFGLLALFSEGNRKGRSLK